VQSFGRFDEILYLVEKTPALTLPDLERCRKSAHEYRQTTHSHPGDQACRRQTDSWCASTEPPRRLTQSTCPASDPSSAGLFVLLHSPDTGELEA
jgi:hypothetical protein